MKDDTYIGYFEFGIILFLLDIGTQCKLYAPQCPVHYTVSTFSVATVKPTTCRVGIAIHNGITYMNDV